MAGLRHMYKIAFNSAGPKTVCQFVAPTNQRVHLRRVELIPKGATGATAPLFFDLSLQDTAGTSSDGDAARVKSAPVAVEAIQMTARHLFTVEPASSTPKDEISLHQQGARTWEPIDPMVIEGGLRLGFRYLSSQTVDCDFVFYFEE